MKTNKSFIGKRILDSLTAEQIAAVLDVVAASGDVKGRLDRIRQRDPDAATTVAEILKSQGSKPAGRKGELRRRVD